MLSRRRSAPNAMDPRVRSVPLPHLPWGSERLAAPRTAPRSGRHRRRPRSPSLIGRIRPTRRPILQDGARQKRTRKPPEPSGTCGSISEALRHCQCLAITRGHHRPMVRCATPRARFVPHADDANPVDSPREPRPSRLRFAQPLIVRTGPPRPVATNAAAPESACGTERLHRLKSSTSAASAAAATRLESTNRVGLGFPIGCAMRFHRCADRPREGSV